MTNTTKEDPKERIPVNGKAQIIDMLRVMPVDERRALLKNMGQMDKKRTVELMELSISMSNIEGLEESEIQLIVESCSAPVLGVALKNCPEGLQRKALRSLDRKKAEEAFEMLSTAISDEKENIMRAQRRVLQTALDLHKKGAVSLI